MADVFTTTTTQGLGGRLLGSFKNFLVGIILFFVSFFILYWNEGRVDLSVVAEKAVIVQADSQALDTSLEGKFVSVYGAIATDDMLGDGQFLLPGNYLSVVRKVEMYSWVETENSKSTEQAGGSETTQTTYKYNKDWKVNPTNNFKHPEGHENPNKAVADLSVYAKNAMIGGYHFNPGQAKLPTGQEVPLSASNTVLTLGDFIVSLTSNNYIFARKSASSTVATPEVGDIRITYKAVPPAFKGVLFGVVTGNSITPYTIDDTEFYRLFSGTRDEALVTLHQEYMTSLWVYRFIGFLLMFIGLTRFFSPLVVVLSFIPFFGSLGRGAVFMLSLVTSLVLSFITILVSSIIHNPKVLIIVIIVAVISGIGVFMHASKKSQSTPIEPGVTPQGSSSIAIPAPTSNSPLDPGVPPVIPPVIGLPQNQVAPPSVV